jgi:hypothetical protein
LGVALLQSFFAISILLGVDPAHVAAAKNTLPVIDMNSLISILGSLLGIGALSYEKVQLKKMENTK